MEIGLDAKVVASDGKEVGTVDRLALHPDTMDIESIIVHQGIIFTKDRIVQTRFIDHLADDGTVHLNVTSDRAEQLPEFVAERFSHPTEEQLSQSQQGIGVPGTMGGLGRVMVAPPAGGRHHEDAADSIFDPATIPTGEQHTESSLPKGVVSIDEGTDVVDRAGDKVGTVDDIIYDDEGRISGFIVESGFIFTHDVRIPAAWVDGVTHENIRLNVSAADAEREGRITQS